MPAMAPSTSAATSGAKISTHSDLFDPATLFVADKVAREENAQALASLSKNEGVTLFGAIGLPEALVAVSGAASSRHPPFSFTADRPILTHSSTGPYRQKVCRDP